MPTIDVAFLGTGLMGGVMAAAIARADLPVTAWNRTRSRAEPLREHAIVVADTAADAVRDAKIVCCMVSDAAAVESVLFEHGVAEAMRPGAVFVDLSSIPPKTEREHAARLRALGKRHLDAPVSGDTRGARDGALAIMVGGDKDAFVDAMPVLASMGQPIRVGPDGTGQLVKLCNQAIVAITLGGLSEAMRLAAAGGADPERVRDALRGGFVEAGILQDHGARFLERGRVPNGPVQAMLEDLGAVIDAAEETGIDLPFTALARSLYQDLVDRGVVTADRGASSPGTEGRNRPDGARETPDAVPTS